MTVDGYAVDLIDAKCAGGKRRHRNRRRNDRIDPLKYLEERRPQAVTAIAGLDILDAAVGRAFRHDVAVVGVRACECAGIAGRHGRRLLGISDRFQNSLEHVRFEMDAVGNDIGAEGTERLNRRQECHANVRRHRGIAEVGTASDSDSVQPHRRRIEAPRRHRQTGGIAQIMRGDHFQKQRCVGNRPRDRPGMCQRSPRRRRKAGRPRDQSECRFDADHAAESRWHPDRPDAIGADREWTASGGDRSGSTAAGSAAGPISIPGISGNAGHRAIGGELVAGFAGGGLAGDDRTRRFQCRHGGRIDGRHQILVGGSATERADAGDVDEIFDADRHTGQFALRLPGGPGRRGPVGSGTRLIIGRRDDHVAGRVGKLQRGDHVFDDVPRREPLGAIALHQFNGRQPGQFIGFNGGVGAGAP
jgi:hypothetical protein